MQGLKTHRAGLTKLAVHIWFTLPHTAADWKRCICLIHRLRCNYALLCVLQGCPPPARGRRVGPAGAVLVLPSMLGLVAGVLQLLVGYPVDPVLHQPRRQAPRLVSEVLSTHLRRTRWTRWTRWRCWCRFWWCELRHLQVGFAETVYFEKTCFQEFQDSKVVFTFFKKNQDGKVAFTFFQEISR